ncbi:MAG: DUF5723 family protein [Flavobacteriales bacterium]
MAIRHLVTVLFFMPVLLVAQMWEELIVTQPQYGIQGTFWNNSTRIPASIFHHFSGVGSTNQSAADRAAQSGSTHFALEAQWKAFADVYLSSKKKEAGYLSHFSLSQRIIAAGQLMNDGAPLLFMGNRQFENETATADNSHLSLYNYHCARFGFTKQKANYSYGMNLGIAAGRSFVQADVNRFNLFTAPFGEYLDVDMSLSLHQNNARTYYNGAGALLDLHYLRKINEKQSITLQLSDLGFMRWNEQTTRETADTSFRFEGLVIDDLFNFDGENINIGDTLNNLLGISTRNASITTLLPFRLTLNYHYVASDWLSLNGTLAYHHLLHRMPWVRLGGRFRMSNEIDLSAGLQLLGAGIFNPEIGITYRKDRFQLAVNALAGESFNFNTSSGSGLMMKLIIFTQR